MYNARELARTLRIGKLLYYLYYAPGGFVRQVMQDRPVNRSLSYLGRLKMEKAVRQLSPIPLQDETDLSEVHFLSGRRFWYQTCFCAYSLMRNAGKVMRLVVYDDGSLQGRHVERFKELFPEIRIHSTEEIKARLDQDLPEAKFPYLRGRRLVYPHLRKLTDVHVGSCGWKLVLDSDMLFFRAPVFLLKWLNAPQGPCHMVDIDNSYGYSEQLMASLAGAPISDCLNVGICGLKSEDVDWEQLEFWCKIMLEREGSSYYQEQALTAMLMAGKSCEVAPAEDYIVLPTREEVIAPKAVLHHYVATSKSWYFRYGWKHVATS